jgi:hypothetical protein
MIDTKPLPNMRLAELIGKAIDSTDLQDNEIAPLCNVSPQAVYSWRKTGRIGKGTLKKLAAATKMPMSYFLDEPENISGTSRGELVIEKNQQIDGEASVNIADLNKLVDSFLRSDIKGRRQILTLAVDVASKTTKATATAANDQR